MKNFVGNIFITEHAKQRFIERRINVTRYKENTNLCLKMINMIHRSILKKVTKLDETKVIEYREFDGCIFICQREFSKDFLKKDLVTIITVELTPRYIKNTIDKGYEINDLSLNSYTLEKVEELFI